LYYIIVFQRNPEKSYLAMSYCFNPDCLFPDDASNAHQDTCCHCHTTLVIANRYRGLQKLGKSFLALTVEVQDLETGQEKVLKLLINNQPKAQELFVQEADVLRNIKHPGIVTLDSNGYFQIPNAGILKGKACLVMEKIEGQSLDKFLSIHGSISSEKAYEWLLQLTAILEQLHSHEFFHRDLKPSNIFLRPDGKLVLIDFGASRQVTDTYLGKVGVGQDITCIGTPGYMPPEQMEGRALPQSDFFALARTMVHLLTGRHPIELPRHQDTGALLWREVATQVPSALADLIDAMMAQQPGQRPPTIQALQERLQTLNLADVPLSRQSNPKTLWQILQKRVGLLPISIWVGGLSLLSISGGLLLTNRVRFRTSMVNSQPIVQKTVEQPKVTCQNISCIGRDPVDNKCDRDKQTITSNTGNIRRSKNYLAAYRMELRYSKACQAVWARDEAPAGSVHYVEDQNGKRYGTATIPVDAFKEHYSDMGPGLNISVRACVQPPKHSTTCTSFVQL
jgi:serine/threonine protein kinase